MTKNLLNSDLALTSPGRYTVAIWTLGDRHHPALMMMVVVVAH